MHLSGSLKPFGRKPYKTTNGEKQGACCAIHRPATNGERLYFGRGFFK